jgi:hypothetical protein
MTEPCDAQGLMLHVFEQGGGWHWALTVERTLGSGKRVIAFSRPMFRSEAQARTDGMRTLAQTCEEILAGPTAKGMTTPSEQYAAP